MRTYNNITQIITNTKETKGKKCKQEMYNVNYRLKE